MTQENWHDQSTYESLITYGYNAIKYVLLINGGAILAILTFIGSHTERSSDLKFVIPLFILGVVSGGVAVVCAYFTQLYLFNKNNKYLTYQTIALWSICIGIFLFLAGALYASCALTIQ